jgi:hypothetical protein
MTTSPAIPAASEATSCSGSSARDIAKKWVRHLIARGYTCEDIDREVYMGYGGPGEVGYEVSHGKVFVRHHKFSFRQLAEELNQPEQAMLV